ncbi:MAG: hypothetical protein IPK13_25220 [Deltaproteobacteria bacterium]|nr:hypothetical protein [Deltaproteobacteria bacterium]
MSRRSNVVAFFALVLACVFAVSVALARPSKRRRGGKRRGPRAAVSRQLPRSPAASRGESGATATATTRRDRRLIVGAPFLDARVPSGVYLWLEDGWLQLVALSNDSSPKDRVFQVMVVSTGNLESRELGEFRRGRHDRRRFSASVRATQVPAKGRFKSDGDVTVTVREEGKGTTVSSEPLLFVGPLAEPVPAGIEIGRY